MHCPNCGVEIIPENAKFCYNCAENLQDIPRTSGDQIGKDKVGHDQANVGSIEESRAAIGEGASVTEHTTVEAPLPPGRHVKLFWGCLSYSVVNAVAVSLFILTLLIIQYFLAFQSDVATIYVEEGSVLVIRQQEGRVEQIQVATSFRLEPDDQIIMESGNARIEFFEGQSTMLSADAHVELEKLTQEEGATEVVLVVYNGETHHEIITPLDENDRFVVRAISPTQTEDITSTSDNDVITTVTSTSDITSFDVTVDADQENETIVSTDTGSVDVTRGDEDVKVEATTQVIVTANEPLEVEVQPEAMPQLAPTATLTDEPTALVIATPTPLPVPETAVLSVATVLAMTLTPTQTIALPLDIRLLSPLDGAIVEGTVTFEWEPFRSLQNGEGYEVIFWKPGQDPMIDGFSYALPINDALLSLDLTSLSKLPIRPLEPGEYRWSVRLVEMDPYRVLGVSGKQQTIFYEGESSAE